MKKIFKIIVFFLIINASAKAETENKNEVSTYFLSLKYSEANLRVGPSKNYPIKLKYIFPTMPLEIKDEFQKWRKVVDFEKNEGWIHVRLLSENRYGIIKQNDKKYVNIYNKPDGKLIGRIGIGNVVEIKKCREKWCKIKIEKYKGWLKQVNIWGILDNENFD